MVLCIISGYDKGVGAGCTDVFFVGYHSLAIIRCRTGIKNLRRIKL